MQKLFCLGFKRKIHDLSWKFKIATLEVANLEVTKQKFKKGKFKAANVMTWTAISNEKASGSHNETALQVIP